ncbi:YkvA family protein [Lysobacter arvi]|uniref:DUF1232 domain-containing protein n=1 Tax=Lysobacter arvi TaxID=3038776 RepID=A0ABU1CCD1_9GAMM|nr:DUF1232 domain-containing protein [Lysobacter arvi]MDR0182841.1 DUF1232 domain-containing protein [Lysobacter arvi]
MSRLRGWAQALKQQTLIVWFAARDARTPRFARALALVVAAYALSPIDLIPDFIPVLGYLDDVILVPLGLWLVLRMVPPEVIADSQAKAAAMSERPVSRGMAAVVVAIWAIALAVLGVWAWRTFRR